MGLAPQRCYLLSLPIEILDMILEPLPMMMLPAFVVAVAPGLVRQPGFPPISKPELRAMARFASLAILPKAAQWSAPAAKGLQVTYAQVSATRLLSGFHALPLELWYIVGDELKLADRLAFAVAVWHSLARKWRNDDRQRRKSESRGTAET